MDIPRAIGAPHPGQAAASLSMLIPHCLHFTSAMRALHFQARLAAAVRHLRSGRGWTQEEAAHRCGMTTRLLQRVEGSEVNLTLTALARLCEGFGVDVAQLLQAPNKGR